MNDNDMPDNDMPDNDMTRPDTPPDEAADATVEQGTLPLDTGADEPIAYGLTARARRVVAPATLPDLAVLPADEDDADALADGAFTIEPGDTRPARARALRRAGTPFDRISRELDLDELVVRSWCGDIGAAPKRRLRVVTPPPPTVTATDVEAGTEATVVGGRQAAAGARAAARREATVRLASAPASFVGGLGLTVSRAELSDHAVLVTVDDRATAAAIVHWLVDEAGVDPRRLRVVLRLAPGLAADVTVHAWGSALGLPSERIVHTRWSAAPTGSAVEALIRCADPHVAARVAGWRDALLADLGVEPAATYEVDAGS